MRFNCFGGRLPETMSFTRIRNARGFQEIKCRQGIALLTMLKMVLVISLALIGREQHIR